MDRIVGRSQSKAPLQGANVPTCGIHHIHAAKDQTKRKNCPRNELAIGIKDKNFDSPELPEYVPTKESEESFILLGCKGNRSPGLVENLVFVTRVKVGKELPPFKALSDQESFGAGKQL